MYSHYIKCIANDLKFSSCEVEKADRITNLLRSISYNELLHKNLALKGTAAINVVFLNLPKVPNVVEFNLDTIENKEDTLKILLELLKSNGYKVNVIKNKSMYEINIGYKNVQNHKDSIKIIVEIKSKKSRMKNIEIEFTSNIFNHKRFSVNCVNPIEVYAETIFSLLTNFKSEIIEDIYHISELNIFDDHEHLVKEILTNDYL